ncbi:hypothetical protein BWQ96_03106 [Gracilariopsis chorda]|uniref:Uncharacterized protein n=1 Tax=Gracilariopsis chorda TaxID=448386 RepID=A0A2V3IYE7_9FLOR|nr:hypothetical protein BWQ96_03106 [Gracilariopsis chorda]|eukprot:PXF47164.1 hypothetical protein BWQ96_03106 [Gracilariopsis chorda]
MHRAALFIVVIVCLLSEARSHHKTFRGHWEKTWDVSSTQFDSANFGFAFSGHVDVSRALRDSNAVFRNLEGKKILTIGGGNSNGAWTRRYIRKLNKAIRSGSLNSYHGIAYDIEEGQSGLTGDFLRSFWEAKRHGFFVLVTVSKTAPYGIRDARRLMWNIIHSRHVDVISPIMYPSGQNFQQCSDRGGVDFSTMQNVPWSWYRRSRAYVVPSLWRSSFYREAQSFLRGRGIVSYGYIVWCR